MSQFAPWPETYLPGSLIDQQQEMLRCMSPVELQQLALQQMLASQCVPRYNSLNDLNALTSYRPPVHVPAGWADWSAHASEMT